MTVSTPDSVACDAEPTGCSAPSPSADPGPETPNEHSSDLQPQMNTVSRRGPERRRKTTHAEPITAARMRDLLWGSNLSARVGYVQRPHTAALLTVISNMKYDGGFHSAEVGAAVFDAWWSINGKASRGKKCGYRGRDSSKQSFYGLWDHWELKKAMYTLPLITWRARKAVCPGGLEAETPTTQLAGKVMREASQYHAGEAVPMANVIMGLALNKKVSTGHRALRRLEVLGYVTRTRTGRSDWKTPAGILPGYPSEYVWNATALPTNHLDAGT